MRPISLTLILLLGCGGTDKGTTAQCDTTPDGSIGAPTRSALGLPTGPDRGPRCARTLWRARVAAFCRGATPPMLTSLATSGSCSPDESIPTTRRSARASRSPATRPAIGAATSRRSTRAPCCSRTPTSNGTPTRCTRCRVLRAASRWSARRERSRRGQRAAVRPRAVQPGVRKRAAATTPICSRRRTNRAGPAISVYDDKTIGNTRSTACSAPGRRTTQKTDPAHAGATNPWTPWCYEERPENTRWSSTTSRAHRRDYAGHPVEFDPAVAAVPMEFLVENNGFKQQRTCSRPTIHDESPRPARARRGRALRETSSPGKPSRCRTSAARRPIPARRRRDPGVLAVRNGQMAPGVMPTFVTSSSTARSPTFVCAGAGLDGHGILVQCVSTAQRDARQTISRARFDVEQLGQIARREGRGDPARSARSLAADVAGRGVGDLGHRDCRWSS